MVSNRLSTLQSEAAMNTAERPAPFLVADDPALDFLNSVASPWGAPIEWLEDGRDLLTWLAAAGLVEPADARRLSRTWSADAVDAAAAEARSLREWFRGVVSRRRANGARGLTDRDVARLNAVLSRDAAHARVVRVRGRDLLRTVRRYRAPGDLLVAVAEAMARLLCQGDFALIRRCASPECTLWFYDRTKAHARRWCSMAVCGNRMKAAAHRERMRMHASNG
jgi:predicted RNA-binding Zn ribbon-like protein